MFSLYLSTCSELGVHVDGFIATVGHTLVVGSSKVRVMIFRGRVSANKGVNSPRTNYSCIFVILAKIKPTKILSQ